MTVDGAINRRREIQPNPGHGNGNSLMAPIIHSTQRLRLKPNPKHKPESYQDLKLEFTPLLFSSLEPYLPSTVICDSREIKLRYMRDILQKFWPDRERTRGLRLKNYRQKIISNYQPLHKEIYRMQARNFFKPKFLKAIKENKLSRFQSLVSEPAPGIYSFEMFQPRFSEKLLSEVENFEKWVGETKFRIMRPNIMNNFGAVLDDFGLETMLGKLMVNFILPLAKVFFPEVGGCTLDSHHGFVVEYGFKRDADLGLHVDDSEVTLNVCLGKQFSGGELLFRGVRCDKHVNTETQPEEIYDYSHVPGQAILHRGRHRHGARATTDGNRINLILWCRSSVFRELKKSQKDFSSWCGECQQEKKERQQLAVSATRMELLKRDGKPSFI